MTSRADTGGTGRGFTALFVRRPILAVVLNSLIVIAGLAASGSPSSATAWQPDTASSTTTSAGLPTAIP